MARAIITILGNAFALWAANWVSYHYAPGFLLSTPWTGLILIALILSLLNFLLKPLLTLALGPFVILTLGLALIVVNAVILYLLYSIVNNIDLLQGSIIIQNIPALFVATLVIGAVNFIIHLAL